ncbi:MAG TPA: hypothetical protein VM537_01630 [Anaerolineae bacterium]|nr:hypothetical protein [Anaerolineae bacterium]
MSTTDGLPTGSEMEREIHQALRREASDLRRRLYAGDALHIEASQLIERLYLLVDDGEADIRNLRAVVDIAKEQARQWAALTDAMSREFASEPESVPGRNVGECAVALIRRLRAALAGSGEREPDYEWAMALGWMAARNPFHERMEFPVWFAAVGAMRISERYALASAPPEYTNSEGPGGYGEIANNVEPPEASEEPQYRFLEAGERVRFGDEYDAAPGWNDAPDWRPVTNPGMKAPDPSYPAHARYRRPVPPVEPEPVAWQAGYVMDGETFWTASMIQDGETPGDYCCTVKRPLYAAPPAAPEGREPCACGRRGPYPHQPHLPGCAPTPNCPEGYAMCDGAWCMVHGCGRYEEAKVVPPRAQEREGFLHRTSVTIGDIMAQPEAQEQERRERVAKALWAQAVAVDFTLGGPTEDTDILREASALLCPVTPREPEK